MDWCRYISTLTGLNLFCVTSEQWFLTRTFISSAVAVPRPSSVAQKTFVSLHHLLKRAHNTSLWYCHPRRTAKPFLHRLDLRTVPQYLWLCLLWKIKNITETVSTARRATWTTVPLYLCINPFSAGQILHLCHSLWLLCLSWLVARFYYVIAR